MVNMENMLLIELSEETHSIQVRTSEDDNPRTVAIGNFAVDAIDRCALVVFDSVDIRVDDYQLLDQLLSVVVSHVGQLYKALVFIRLPASFDQNIDLEKLQFRTDLPTAMVAAMEHSNVDSNELLQGLQSQYELIHDRQVIFDRAESILQLMKSNAYWTEHWSLKEMRRRILSATVATMVLDRVADVPCAFGRMIILSTDNQNRLSYLSDITVDQRHQSKGLGRMIVNFFFDASVEHDASTQFINGTLCLYCSDQGSGAVSATKLYTRSGFQFLSATGNEIAMFASQKHFLKLCDEV